MQQERKNAMEQMERLHILQVLEQARNVVGGPNGAAARLGVPRTTLIYKMRRLGIKLGQSSALPTQAGEFPNLITLPDR